MNQNSVSTSWRWIDDGWVTNGMFRYRLILWRKRRATRRAGERCRSSGRRWGRVVTATVSKQLELPTKTKNSKVPSSPPIRCGRSTTTTGWHRATSSGALCLTSTCSNPKKYANLYLFTPFTYYFTIWFDVLLPNYNAHQVITVLFDLLSTNFTNYIIYFLVFDSIYY